MDRLFNLLGEPGTAAAAGLVLGLAFGFLAQRSRFCLRSAVMEFGRRSREGKLTVWLFAFASAVLATQAFVLAGWLDVQDARQLSARGSLSGAATGGLLFGAGMMLARGCSSRLLVLAAQGNLRSLVSGLVFAVTAQAAGSGVLAAPRQALAALWTVEGGTARDLIALTGIGHVGAALFGAAWLVAAVVWARRQRVGVAVAASAVGVGAVVALAWLVTYHLSRAAFDSVIPVQALSFTGPSAEVLMMVLASPLPAPRFDLGLVPGVVLGSFTAALLARELKLEGFQGAPAMRRSIIGAVLMGFGGMLAGGCAVGAGVSGAAVFALTAWVTLCGIWLGGLAVDRFVDHLGEGGRPADPAGQAAASSSPVQRHQSLVKG